MKPIGAMLGCMKGLSIVKRPWHSKQLAQKYSTTAPNEKWH